MKFFDVVLVSLMVAFFIIGIHQSITMGFGNSYWIFMLTIVFMLWFKLRNNKDQSAADTKKDPKINKLSRNKVKGK